MAHAQFWLKFLIYLGNAHCSEKKEQMDLILFVASLQCIYFHYGQMTTDWRNLL